MSLTPRLLKQYHVFLASPGDVDAERQHVRRFFDDYNRSTAHLWNAEFRVIDWENYATIGVGRPQELITQQTLEKYRGSLALVVGIMGQRFGSPTGKAESGTDEEFNWAMQSHKASGFPEIKWFFRKADKLEMPADPDAALNAVEQWRKVLAFRKRMQDFDDPVFYTEYPGADRFHDVFDRDLNLWLSDASRPWAAERAAEIASSGASLPAPLPPEFDSERYRAAVLKRFDKLNFEMLDTTGAFYSGVRLWSVFVPQSARECHQYNPRLLEIPKEHQKRLLEAGEISAEEFATDEWQADQLRREYFSQPLRRVLDVVDEALRVTASPTSRRLVILGDPGSGKSSLIKYLALRWASIADRAARDTQPIPLVIDLGSYGRWQCEGRRGFVRFLEEAPVWHDWPPGLLERLLQEPGRVVLLLDGLDEIFDLKARAEAVNDIQRFSNEHANVPIFLTSRAVGYQPQWLRDAEFRHFMLQDLDAAQIDAFVERWHDVTFADEAQAAPKRERLKKAVRDSKSISMLAGNPLLLTMMAILNRNQELPRDRVDLYGQASRVLLHQWDTERALEDFPGLNAEIGWREKGDMLRRLASFMQAGPSGLKGNMIDGATLTRLIEDYLRTQLHFEQSRAAARAVVEHLRQRNFILCFVGADSYGFVHRTFLEYFCAADFVHQFNVAKTLNVQGLIALFEQRCRDDDWREVLRLICGQIDEQFVGRIVEHLAEWMDWNRTTPPELPLAIWCLGECRNVGKLANAGAALMRQCVRLLEQLDTRDASFWFDQVIPACRELGERWPEKRIVYTFEHQGRADILWGRTHQPWVTLVALVDSDREKMSELTQSRHSFVKASAIWFLAQKWPDETTHTLLVKHAVQDQETCVRVAALKALAANWPNQTTRTLLTEYAVEERDGYARSAALQALAEKWPDETTQTLLTERAVQDQEGYVRNVALQSLAERWRNETTRALLTKRAVEDESEFTRGCAASLVGATHSEFGRRLYTRYANGSEPYLDPHVPLPVGHIEWCASWVRLPADQWKTTLAEVAELLGWDVTVGARPQAHA